MTYLFLEIERFPFKRSAISANFVRKLITSDPIHHLLWSPDRLQRYKTALALTLTLLGSILETLCKALKKYI